MDAVRGNKVSFQSKAPNDNNLYQGEIKGFVTFDIAKTYSDITTYHSNVKSIDNDIDVIENLNFFLLDTGSDAFGLMPFAEEWVETGTLKIIEAVNIVTFEVSGVPNSDAAKAIASLIRNEGYNVKQTSAKYSGV